MKIAIANAKGGVGKTTTAIYLATAAAMRGIPTRVWDADIQASASLWGRPSARAWFTAAIYGRAGKFIYPQPADQNG